MFLEDYFPLDFALSFLGRLVKHCQVSGRAQRIILVGNKSDLARKRQVETKVTQHQSSDVHRLFSRLTANYLQQVKDAACRTTVLRHSKYIILGGAQCCSALQCQVCGDWSWDRSQHWPTPGGDHHSVKTDEETQEWRNTQRFYEGIQRSTKKTVSEEEESYEPQYIILEN